MSSPPEPAARATRTPSKPTRPPQSQPVGAAPGLERRLIRRARLALLLAVVRYLRLTPLIGRELARWRRRAQQIDDVDRRALALEKLRGESFNAEAAAMLATLAPRATRATAVRAIVALEVLYDYLDGLTESPSGRAAGDGELLMGAFTDAIDPSRPCAEHYPAGLGSSGEDGYLAELVDTARRALSMLPGIPAVAEQLRLSAARGAAAQLRLHRADLVGGRELERWSRLRCAETSLQWREYLAGAACSVLAVHALVAAAADARTTSAQAVALDRAYLPISALPTMLDSLIDADRDRDMASAGLAALYPQDGISGDRLAEVADVALDRAEHAPNPAHHVMILVGVLAYYASAPGAREDPARSAIEMASVRLQPLIWPTMLVMRLWRTARRLLRGRVGHISAETRPPA